MPLLTDERYASMLQQMALAAYGARLADQNAIARLVFFAMDFGLLRLPDRSLRAFGAALLAFPEELRVRARCCCCC